LISVNTCPCIFFLRNLKIWCAFDTWCYRECWLYKRLWKQPPIATTDPRVEITVFEEKLKKIRSRFAIGVFSSTQLSKRKIVFYIKNLFPQVSQCISFLPNILKQFYNICMASINIIRFHSRHIRNWYLVITSLNVKFPPNP
jgi:hypothetical protein